MHLPVDPDGVRQAGVQVDHIDGVVLLPQGADDLLAPDIALLPLQALPQDIMDILEAEDGGEAAARPAQERSDSFS